MKTTFITVCILTLFAGVAASSFSDGMTSGFIASNIGRKFKTKKKSFIKYNNFTRDTSLQKFPPVSSPQCILEKIKIVPPPLTIGQRIVTTFIIFLILCSFMHLLFFGTEKERDWFIGYLIGNMIEEMFNDD